MNGVRLALGLVLVLVLAGTARAEEHIIAVCWARSGALECGAAVTEERATQYARSQCVFWGNTKAEKSQCREVWRCTRPGWGGVAYDRTSKAIRATTCGVTSAAERSAALRARCRDCFTYPFKLRSVPDLDKVIDFDVPERVSEAALHEVLDKISDAMLRAYMMKVLGKQLSPPFLDFAFKVHDLVDDYERLTRDLDVTVLAREQLAREIEKLTKGLEDAERQWKSAVRTSRDKALLDRVRAAEAIYAKNTPENAAKRRQYRADFDRWMEREEREREERERRAREKR